MILKSLRKKFVSLMALALLFTSMGLSAREVNLLEIISEPEGNKKHLLTLGLDDQGDILKIMRKSQASVQSFSINELNEGGVVLYRTEGRDVFKLSSRSLDSVIGGDVLLTYLTDGITNRFEDLELYLKRNGDEWFVESESGNRVSQLILKSRKFFGKIIGIKKVIIK
jgi:hypothetical protein